MYCKLCCNFICAGKHLKERLKKKDMLFCGEVDQFRKGKIQIADLQISTELPCVEQTQCRSDMAKVFRKAPSGNVSYENLFKEVERRVQDIPTKGYNHEAEENFVSKYGNLLLISGRPGVGKTTLTKRMVYEMWNFSLFEAEMLFLIQFRDLDYKKETDLLEFLIPLPEDFLRKEDRKKLIEKIGECDNIFIMLDGFDEAKIDPKMKDFKRCYINSRNTAEGFIQNLIAGNILQNCKKLITSRPYRVAQLPANFLPKILLHIQGLDEKGLEQICSNICGVHKTRCKKILRYLKVHPDIKSYCHTPVICIMVMERLNKMYEAAESSDVQLKNLDPLKSNQVNTLTAIFVDALTKWLLEKDQMTSCTNLFPLKNIAAFAYNKLDENQFYFTSFELREAGVGDQHIKTFLSTILRGSRKMYFIHLMWQEFLAAIKLRLFTEKEDFSKVVDGETKSTQNNIFSKLSGKQYEMVTTKFLFGLCNTDTLNTMLEKVEIEEGFNNESNRISCKKMLQDFVITKLETYRNTDYLADTNPVDDECDSDDSADESGNGGEDRGVPSGDNGDGKSDSDLDSVDIQDDGGGEVSDEDDDTKSYFSSVLPILGWVHEMKDNDFTKRAANCLRDKMYIEAEQILPSDIPVINYIFRSRAAKLTLKVHNLQFVGTCSEYFFKELNETLNLNPKIQVQYYKIDLTVTKYYRLE